MMAQGLEWADFSENIEDLFRFQFSFLAKDESNTLSLRWKPEKAYKFLTYVDKCKTWKDGFIYCK